MTTAGGRVGHGEAIKALLPGQFLTVAKRLVHGGSLQARKLQSGAVQFYWRYSHEGATHREPVGVYDPSAPPKSLQPTAKGYSIAAAQEACRVLGAAHAARAHTGGLKEVKAEEAKAYGARKAKEEAQRANTLAALLEVYVDYLEAQGRNSYREVRNLVQRNVVQPWPKLAGKPAAEVLPDEILDILRRLVEQKKGRSANKLRSYLRAAYQCAIDVRTTASIPVAFKAFGIIANPAALTKRDAKYDRADKNPLTLAELRTYWKRVQRLDGLAGTALRTHLLTGGQRIEQIARLRWADVRDDALTIFDGKGRPGRGPRPHLLPMLPALADNLAQLAREGEYVLSTSDGRKPVSTTSMAGWARTAVGDSIPGFQLKRVRSGIETALAARGISREIRGHLQSHGLTGVQARHYDGHDYMPEKRNALELLFDLLDSKPQPKVLPMEKHRA